MAHFLQGATGHLAPGQASHTAAQAQAHHEAMAAEHERQRAHHERVQEQGRQAVAAERAAGQQAVAHAQTAAAVDPRVKEAAAAKADAEADHTANRETHRLNRAEHQLALHHQRVTKAVHQDEKEKNPRSKATRLARGEVKAAGRMVLDTSADMAKSGAATEMSGVALDAAKRAHKGAVAEGAANLAAVKADAQQRQQGAVSAAAQATAASGKQAKEAARRAKAAKSNASAAKSAARSAKAASDARQRDAAARARDLQRAGRVVGAAHKSAAQHEEHTRKRVAAIGKHMLALAGKAHHQALAASAQRADVRSEARRV
jgi:hypothetical protein